jgi:hypothetical protein
MKRIRRFNFAFIFYNKKRFWLRRIKLKSFLNLKRKKKYKNFKFLNFLSIISNKFQIINDYKKNIYGILKIFNQFKKVNYIVLNKNKFQFKLINNVKFFFKRLHYKRSKFYKIKRKLKKFLHLDVKYEKQFFYSVHIRKTKYIENFSGKIITEKKKPLKLISLFFGFKKIKKFL